MSFSLKDPRFRLAQLPLFDGCNCLCCERHTLAYIHHLLNTHEMLAHTLLALYRRPPSDFDAYIS